MKIRHIIRIDGYLFNGFPELVFHSHKWWIDEKETKPIYNNGSLSINYYGSKKSIKQLRKLAVKCQIEIIKLPF
mgnify:CR=1 FL=1